MTIRLHIYEKVDTLKLRAMFSSVPAQSWDFTRPPPPPPPPHRTPFPHTHWSLISYPPSHWSSLISYSQSPCPNEGCPDKVTNSQLTAVSCCPFLPNDQPIINPLINAFGPSLVI